MHDSPRPAGRLERINVSVTPASNRLFVRQADAGKLVGLRRDAYMRFLLRLGERALRRQLKPLGLTIETAAALERAKRQAKSKRAPIVRLGAGPTITRL